MSTSANNSNKGFAAWGKEFVRKLLVSLKRNPQFIPFGALILSFLLFSLNLTEISNTTAKIQGVHMGLCIFVSMLLSMLSMICMLNAFPKRQKPKYVIIALLLIMFGVTIFVDIVYCGRVTTAITAPNSPINNSKDLAYILKAKNTIITHVVTIAITAVLTLLEPVFAKLLKKINTSINIEEGKNIGAIEIVGEE